MSDHYETIGIDPRGFRVLIRPMEIETKTAGGLILVDETLKKDEAANIRGLCVAVGPDCFSDKKSVYCAPGDYVLFAKYSGLLYTGADGLQYRIINDEDVVAVLNPRCVEEGKV